MGVRLVRARRGLHGRVHAPRPPNYCSSTGPQMEYLQPSPPLHLLHLQHHSTSPLTLACWLAVSRE